MEKRTLLAIILSIIVLVAWSYLFQPKPIPQKTKPIKQEPLETKIQDKKETIQPSLHVPEESSMVEEGKDVIVETDLYKATLSTKGAIIKSWQLKNYKDKDGAPVFLLEKPGVIPPLGVLFEGTDRNFPQKIIYTTNRDEIILSDKGNSQGEIIFIYNQKGIYIKKKFVFYNNDYKVDLSIETVNTPSYLLPVGTDFGVFNKEQREHKGPVILIDSDRKEFTEKSESKYFTGNIRWIAQEDKYFTAAVIPLSQIEGASVWKEGSTPEIALKLGQQKKDFVLYAGPKEYDRLKQLNIGLEHIIDFGWFSIIAMPLFWVLKFFYKLLGNYGWAIIFLTILTRIPFIPLMHKSQQSMKKMQQINPMITAIREKYKKDPQKMQKEITELYKKHKVNPVGGCLPMLLQLPVFIALYNVLLRAIELRGAPFILWIKDLSARDPYYILPIIMGLSMLIQQKMTPSADPKQAKMMMFMPIVFTFIFLTFPSGLVLYWLINNILAIIQQHYANKKAST